MIVLLYYYHNTIVKGGNSMPWNIESDRPVYLQIVEHIMNDIFSGRIKTGEQLKSVRDLATEAAVNPNTMQKAGHSLPALFPLKKRALQPHGLHRPRGVAPSDFRPLWKILSCCLP